MDRQRGPLTTILVVGGGLIVYAGARVVPYLSKEGPKALIPVLLGIPFFVVGIMTQQNVFQANRISRIVDRFRNWLEITQLQFVLVLMSLILSFITVVAAGFDKKMHDPVLAITAWLLGMLFILIGGWRFGEKFRISRVSVVWLLLLMVIAFALRAFGTAQVPIILAGDEGSAGIASTAFIKGEWNNVFIAGWFSFPALFFFVQSLSIRMFGNTTEALRLVSAVAGTLTVGSVYFIGRSLFGRRAGIFTALTLAALHYHIHFSRVGLNNIWDGLWYTIAIGSLCIAWETNKRWAYLLAGLALGMGQYFYASSRSMLLVVLVGFFIALIMQRKKLQQELPGIFLMMTVAVVVVLPLAWFYMYHPLEFLAPMQRVSLVQKLGMISASSGQPVWKILLEQLGKGLQAFTITPILYWYSPEAPILRPIFGTLFYLGLAILLFKYRDSRLILLTLWLFVFGVMGALSDVVPASQRYVASAPVCALIVGLGLHGSTEVLENIWSKYSKAFTLFSYAILSIAMISDIYFYFVTFYGRDLINNIESHGMIAQHVADQVKEMSAGTQVAFFAIQDMGYYSIPSIQYLAPQIVGIDVIEPWHSFDKALLDKDHLVFIVLPSRENELPEVTTQYPGGQLYYDFSWSGKLLFWVYDVQNNGKYLIKHP